MAATSGDGGVEAVKGAGACSDPLMVVEDSQDKEKIGPARGPAGAEDNVAEMLERLNLTSDEADAVILEDEREENLMNLEWALIGKVLSPNVLHIQTIMSALRPAWGNPKGLVARPVADNTFIVEFASRADKERVKEGAPWTVGKHAVLLNDFVPTLKPSEVTFDRIMLWARIINPRFEMMNKIWGELLGAKVGKVEKVDVDAQGRAWGDYLRVRVSVNVAKPLMRWVTAYSKKHKAYETYEVKYERLPHYCFSCGIIGHSSLECPTPGERDEEGKLPYNADKLCVKEEKKKFFSMSKFGQSSQMGARNSQYEEKHGESHPPKANSGEKRMDIMNIQDEVTLPIKSKEQTHKQKAKVEVGIVSKEFALAQSNVTKVTGQKRKQLKVYRPKGQVQVHEEKTHDVSNLASTLPGRNPSGECPFPYLTARGDDDQIDSHKKQKMERVTYSTGSADQAEAAAEQPCQTQ